MEKSLYIGYSAILIFYKSCRLDHLHIHMLIQSIQGFCLQM